MERFHLVFGSNGLCCFKVFAAIFTVKTNKNEKRQQVSYANLNLYSDSEISKGSTKCQGAKTIRLK